MPKKKDVLVTTVLVADQYAQSVAKKAKDIGDILKQRYANYEVIIVDNDMPARQFNDLQKALNTTPCLRIIRLSKTHDTDTAIFAGVDAAIGDYVCTLYGKDPIKLIPDFIEKAMGADIVFGVSRNLKRHTFIERLGARIFYWYSRKHLRLNIPSGSTYFICMNRMAANALTRSGRHMRHIRHMAKYVGFKAVNYKYDLPESGRIYSKNKLGPLIAKAIDLISNYSQHPLRFVSYLGIFGGLLNILYAIYVVIVNLSVKDVAKGWTTLSLQTSLMFFLLFMVMAVLAEYIGRILEESRQEPPYHITKELSSKVGIADEKRLNVVE